MHRGPHSREAVVPAVVDTGFDGWLTLPAALVARLGLTRRGRVPALLAGGSHALFDIYAAMVVWDGHTRPVLVGVAEGTSLIGMSLLEGHQLTVDVRDGGEVAIVASAPP